MRSRTLLSLVTLALAGCTAPDDVSRGTGAVVEVTPVAGPGGIGLIGFDVAISTDNDMRNCCCVSVDTATGPVGANGPNACTGRATDANEAGLACVSDVFDIGIPHGQCGWTTTSGGVPLSGQQLCLCRNGGFDCSDPLACALADDGGAQLTNPQALPPTRGALRPVTLSAPAEDTVFVSNNPETVHSNGLLASTTRVPGVRRTYPEWEAEYGPSPVAQISAAGVELENGCPAGTVREMDVYIAHIMHNDNEVGLGVVPVSGDINVTVLGEIAEGPFWNGCTPMTRDRNFVSARVMREFFYGGAPTRTVAARCEANPTTGECQRYTQVAAAHGSGYIDGRLRLTANGCFSVHVLSQNVGASPTRLPNTWAIGNSAWENWYHGDGAGRSCGVYRGGGDMSGSGEVEFTGPNESYGFVVGTEQQALPAVVHFTDSALVNFGDYGGRYNLDFSITNRSTGCIDVVSELLGYGSTRPDERPTYAVHNRQGGQCGLPRSVEWNTTVERRGGSNPTSAPEQLLLYGVKNTNSRVDNNIVVPSIRSRQHRARLMSPGDSTTLGFNILVPGLITAPLGVVFYSQPCGTTQPPAVNPPPQSPPPTGASCTHSFGGQYRDRGCSAAYQCCSGQWRARSPGCGSCACVEETGRTGCN